MVLKLLARIGFSLLLWMAVVSLMANWAVGLDSRGKTFDSVDNVPQETVALVLGTSPKTTDGRVNLYFLYRIQAAKQLFDAGKVKYVLVSGDNGTKRYDEPTAMRNALTDLGIPAERIYLDYAGFRTFDSVVRAKEVFDLKSLIIVSQKFHNERALFVARRIGLRAAGFNAEDVDSRAAPKVLIREWFARVQMLMDLMFGAKPKFLGELIRIGIDPIQ